VQRAARDGRIITLEVSIPTHPEGQVQRYTVDAYYPVANVSIPTHPEGQVQPTTLAFQPTRLWVSFQSPPTPKGRCNA